MFDLPWKAHVLSYLGQEHCKFHSDLTTISWPVCQCRGLGDHTSRGWDLKKISQLSTSSHQTCALEIIWPVRQENIEWKK